MDIIDLLNVRRSDFDGKPIKNKLPQEIKELFKTEKQWLEEGMQLKEDACFVEMHPNATSNRVCKYYTEDEVELMDSSVEICANCGFQHLENGRCLIMGDFVSVNGHCSEWIPNR